MLVYPPSLGGESNPFLATDDADSFTGSQGYDWVSYAGSSAGVDIDLNNNPATVSGGWAAGDTLTKIKHLIGSAFADTLSGDSSANILHGGGGVDTYVFASGDGTDTITDDGGNIIFEQGAGSDYADAVYTFIRANKGRGEAVTLTVTQGSDTLNVIKFTSDPSSYTFYTRNSGTDTRIPTSELVVPPRVLGDGSESNPYLATASCRRYRRQRKLRLGELRRLERRCQHRP